ncbi:MAG TPA: GMC family oxidoreductase [Solirubrobacteraceae bacterium]|nr:GMC family oxidoreductase [Solirubrobacteraceae bacterium]
MSARRPTGAAAYRSGTGTFHPPERRLCDGGDIGTRREIRADACVIGSGAGGAPVAKELAEGGMRVVILEEGDWWETDELRARPRDSMARLYRDAGQIATIGNPPIVLPMGRAVGGTTLVNSGTCFRTPAPVLELWRRRFGLEAFTEEELDPYFRRVERILNVAQVPAELAGRNAEVVRRGADALGLSGDYLYRNVRGCVGSGVCAYGCPTGAKQHVGITYVPQAWAAGATTYTGVRAQRLELRAGRVVGVRARTRSGGELRVRCDQVIVACGALLTPGFLARQRLGAGSGQLGRNLSIHPATAVRASFDERIDMWDGVPQSYYVDALADQGVMLEGIAGPPDHLAMSTPRVGAEHRDLMLDARQVSMFGVMVSDVSRGRVRSVLGRPQVRYDLVAEDVARFKLGLELLTDIYWAAGAREVIVPVRGMPTLRGGDCAPLREHRWQAADLSLMGFHPLGTARAGADARRAVLDQDLAVRGVAGLHVSDASAVPSSLGVNPQITIMALATRLAFHLLGVAAPTHEPEPEHMARPRISSAHLPAGEPV